jgi:hypothetical protein
MGEADVQRAAQRIAAALGEMGIPYVICGALAVTAHGHVPCRRGTPGDEGVLDDGDARCSGVELGLLREVSHRQAAANADRSPVGRLLPGVLRASVDLPAPFAPMRPTFSRRASVNVASSRTT